MAAQPLAHQRLGERAVAGAERGQGRDGEPAYRNYCFGKAAVAAGVVVGDALEPWKEDGDGEQDKRRFD
jgi:hypothetical protein